MQLLFIPNSLVDLLNEYGKQISPVLTIAELTSFLPSNEMIYCQGMTSVILDRYRTVRQDQPFTVAGEFSIPTSNFHQSLEAQELFAASGLDANINQSLATLNCVVTLDDAVLVYRGDGDVKPEPFLERVITSMAETKSIDDIMQTDVCQYYCKNF